MAEIYQPVQPIYRMFLPLGFPTAKAIYRRLLVYSGLDCTLGHFGHYVSVRRQRYVHSLPVQFVGLLHSAVGCIWYDFSFAL